MKKDNRCYSVVKIKETNGIKKTERIFAYPKYMQIYIQIYMEICMHICKYICIYANIYVKNIFSYFTECYSYLFS